MTTIWEEISVDGTFLRDYGEIEDLGGLYASGGRRGSNYEIPGRDGELHTVKPRAAYTISIGVALFGTDPITGAELADDDARTRAFNYKYLDLLAVCDPPDGLVVLTRYLSLPGAVTISQTCSAELVDGMSPTLLGLTDGRVVLNFRNLDGAWTDVVGS